MKKVIITIMSIVVIALGLGTTAFAAETNIGSAIWADEYSIYSCSEDSVITVIPKETAVKFAPAIEVEAIVESGFFCMNHSASLKDIGSAIWADEFATYTADGSGEIVVYFDKEYVCGVCHPYEDADTDGIGPAICACPIGIITASAGTQRVFLDEGYVCAGCAERTKADIGPAIMTDEYATYIAGNNGTTVVYFNQEYVCGICTPHEDADIDGISSPIWVCPIETIIAANGVLYLYLNDGYTCATCAELA